MDGSNITRTITTGTGTGHGGIAGITTKAAKAGKGKAKAKAKTKAAKAKAEAAAKEAKDLAEAQRIAAAATYGGEEAWGRLPGALRRDLLAEAWLLMHPTIEERAEREKRQRAAGVDPEKIPLERTLKNQWRNERERVARQGKILAFGYAITVAAVAGEVAEAARPRPALAEFTAFGAFASAGGAS